MADFSPAGEVPGVGEALALLGLCVLDAAAAIDEHAAGVVGVLENREPIARGVDPRVLIDEFLLAEVEEGRDFGHLRVRDPHITRPTTACGAAIALVEGGWV